MRCQHGSTCLFHDGPIYKTVATVKCNNVMDRKLQKGWCDDNVTVKLKRVMMFKNNHSQAKTPKPKQSIFKKIEHLPDQARKSRNRKLIPKILKRDRNKNSRQE